MAIEYLGFLPVLLLAGLAGLQLGLAAYVAQQAGTAARAAARADTTDEPFPGGAAEAGFASMSGWVQGRAQIAVSGGVATVTVTIPEVVPFWSFDPVTKTATMPVPPDEEDLP
ncbi:TadE/TadG family type IV pilus assembly protein [Streptomyces sp. NPDC056144]|uniref:TadE/TadG family type IV pilus assembly protein n=1 Tax=unclassified Streptomyces TaxID=2593676 RepID=UPI0035E2BA23